MLRPDVQAEILLDFQEERTRTIQKSHKIETDMPVVSTTAIALSVSSGHVYDRIGAVAAPLGRPAGREYR